MKKHELFVFLVFNISLKLNLKILVTYLCTSTYYIHVISTLNLSLFYVCLYVCIKTLDLFPRKVSIKLSEWRFELDGDKRRKNLRE